MDTCVCTVLAVKPFSGYYPSCGSCLRKLRRVETSGSASLWCGWCHLTEYTTEEAPLRYCIALTVTDALCCAEVVLFGERLNPVFGAPASELHQYLIQKSSCFSGRQDFTAYTSALLRELLQKALVGRCFLFQFPSKCSNKTTRTRLSDLLRNSEAHNEATSPHRSLIATSMRPLGSSGRSATVVALLEELFTQQRPLHDAGMGDLGTLRGHESSEGIHDSFRNQHASPETATPGPEEKDSSSYLYDASHLSTSETSTVLQLESYYGLSATSNCNSCCASIPDQSTCTFVDPSGCTSADQPVKMKSGTSFHQSPLSETEIRSITAPNSGHHRGVSAIQFQPSPTESRFPDIDSLIDADEVLKDLTSDWETQVQTSSASSKSLPLIDTQLAIASSTLHSELEMKSDSSFSDLGETFLTEFQRSFSDPTPNGRHSVSVSNTSAISALHSCVATPHAYTCSPELFPDTASASSRENHGSNPVSSAYSPELFSSPSSIELKLSSVSDSAAERRDSDTSKHSHASSNIFTPQILRHSNAPRRNILREVTNRTSGGARLIVGTNSFPGTPMTPHDSVKKAVIESAPFSPDLFSP